MKTDLNKTVDPSRHETSFFGVKQDFITETAEIGRNTPRLRLNTQKSLVYGVRQNPLARAVTKKETHNPYT